MYEVKHSEFDNPARIMVQYECEKDGTEIVWFNQSDGYTYPMKGESDSKLNISRNYCGVCFTGWLNQI